MILIILESSGFVPDFVFRTGEILPEFRVPDSGPDLKVPHKPDPEACHTVSLFSFGPVVQSSFMKPEMKKAFLEAFTEFPDIHFLWKYEKDEHQVAKGYKNVFTGKWLLQKNNSLQKMNF